MARLDEKVKSLIAVALSDLLIAFCLLSLPTPAAENAQGVLEIQIEVTAKRSQISSNSISPSIKTFVSPKAET
jgi:hypothetical protein